MPPPLKLLRARTRPVALLLLAAMLLGAGQLGLGALQVTAWSAMIVGYTQATGSVVEAVSKTFDGQHPCRLCEEVQALASDQTEPDDTDRETVRMPLALGAGIPIIISRPDGLLLESHHPVLRSTPQPVISPPPRV